MARRRREQSCRSVCRDDMFIAGIDGVWRRAESAQGGGQRCPMGNGGSDTVRPHDGNRPVGNRPATTDP